MLTRLLVLLLLVLPVPALAKTERHFITVDGLKREFLLYVPKAAAPATGRRLVIVLHGGGGAGRQIMRSTDSLFNELAEGDGTLIAYPDAIGRVWDFGEGRISEALDEPRDDLKFLLAMVQSIRGRHAVDGSRIFATGISRGGQASYFLACRAPGMLRAIAPVAMPLPNFLEDDCKRIPPTPILVINGMKDPIVPYDGGPIQLGRQERGDVLSTTATMDLFRARNRCSSRANSYVIGAVDRIQWDRCAAATELLRVRDGGHTWPGTRQQLPQRLVGPTNKDIDATREIWRFFANF